MLICNPNATERQKWLALCRQALSLIAIAVCCFCHSSSNAQSLSPLSLVDNPFLPTGNPFRTYSTLLPSFVSFDNDRSAYWAIGVDRMNTVETKQKGRTTSHLDGNAYSADLALRISRTTDFELHYQRTEQGGYYAPDNQKPIQAQAGANETEVRFTHHLGAHQIYWGGGFTTTGISGTTNQLSGVLPVFTQTPMASWNQDAVRGSIGLIYAMSRHVAVDLKSSYVNLTGRAVLSDAVNSLSLPTSASGWEQSAVMRVNVDRSTEVIGLWKEARYAGIHDVLISNTKLGNGSTTVKNGMWGLGINHAFGGTGVLELAYFSTLTKFDYHSYNLDPGPLGFSSSADRAGYYLNGSLPQQAVSLSWKQQWSRNHRLVAGFQWINLPIKVDYGYTASSFLIGTSQGGNLDLTGTHLLLLRLLYTMPIKSLGVSFDVQQLVPLSSHRSDQPSSGTSSQTSSGGLFWGIYLSKHF